MQPLRIYQTVSQKLFGNLDRPKLGADESVKWSEEAQPLPRCANKDTHRDALAIYQTVSQGELSETGFPVLVEFSETTLSMVVCYKGPGKEKGDEAPRPPAF